MSEPKEGSLRVYHFPQLQMEKAFHVEASSVDEAIKVLDVLALYDIFQLENNIKPDYCNAQGLEVFEDGEWSEWYSEDGDDIGDHCRYLEEEEE